MNILSVANVNKRFGGLKALDEVNLEVEAGTVHAIIGPNGAGKSTLFRMITGKQDPDSGAVQVSSRSALESALELIRQAQASDSEHPGEADLPGHRLVG